MRREAFGPFSVLSDIDLARLLTLIGSGITLAKLRDGTSRPSTWLNSQGLRPHLPLSVRRIEAFGARIRNRTAMSLVGLVNQAAQSLWTSAELEWAESARLAFDVAGSRDIDVRWLHDLMVRTLFKQGGALVVDRSTAHSFKWDWPLQTAMLGAAESPIAVALVEGFRYDGLIELVNPSAAPRELMLMAGNLVDAVREALSAPQREATLVVVLGDAPDDWPETQALIQVLRSRLRAGAVVLCPVDPSNQRRWLELFVEGLTHNRPVDQALQAAAREAKLATPLIVGDGRFVALSAIAETAKRIGRAILDAPALAASPTFDLPPWGFSYLRGLGTPTNMDYGIALVDAADSMLWAQERGDATALAELKSAIAGLTVGPFHVSRVEAGRIPRRFPRNQLPDSFESPDEGSAEGQAVGRARTLDAAPDIARVEYGSPEPKYAPAEPPMRTPRWVQGDIYDYEGRRSSRVMRNETYALEIFISPVRAGELVGPDSLDERLLPPTTDGHRLKIAFTPLWKAHSQALHPAQVQVVHLPPVGDSGKAIFYFHTPKDLRELRARIVVLTGNRVLQTLILELEEGARQAAKLALSLENIVSTDFGDQSVSPAFDASIVLNDNSAGQVGVTVIAGEQVDFFHPPNINTVVANISSWLTALNTEEGSAGAALTLQDPVLQKLLLDLAINGQSLRQEIVEQAPALQAISQLRNIQFVEAVPKGLFPVEFVYAGQVSIGATMCPNAAKALLDETYHNSCPHAGSSKHHCPALFWGFSKCIERHTAARTEVHKFAQPTTSERTLRPFASMLLATSKNVLDQSILPPDGIQVSLAKYGAKHARAADWEAWRKEVSARSPSTLLLLPHSEASPETGHLAALEIGGKLRGVGEIDDGDVVGSEKKHPIVLVLGCSTALPEVLFVNSLSRFRVAGAAVTLGTLGMITGSQTVRFVEKLLAMMKSAAQQGANFDEAFLRVKRAMLAEGYPFVLSLIAYGNTGWRLED